MILVEFGWLMIWILVFKGSVWPRNHWRKIWSYDLIWWIVNHLVLFLFFWPTIVNRSKWHTFL